MIANIALEKALEEWKNLLGERVFSQETCETQYGPCTFASLRIIPAALLPVNVEEVVVCVKIASQYGIALYPISTGNNWGYGTAHPVVNNCVILDLSQLNTIVEFDAELGLVTLQPGVTQAQLATFLQEQNCEYMVPVTGAGPSCSIVANALERGYGITPYADHFGAVMELEAVLPNGDLYQSSHKSLSLPEISKIYKWGLGPYLDGIFTQGNFGIVTEMTIALATRPEKTKAFLFKIPTEELVKIIPAVHQILKTAGSHIGGLTLINSRRVLAARGVPYPFAQLKNKEILSAELLTELMQHHRVPHWTGLGAIYGTKDMVQACQHFVKQQLKPWCKKISFMTLDTISLIEKILTLIPGTKKITNFVHAAKEGIALLHGYPNQVSLQLAYWKSGHLPPGDLLLNPAKNQCGLLWYAPIVPMKAHAVQKFIELAKKTCSDFQIEPLLAFSSISDKCFDSTLPLLFDPLQPEEVQRARNCYNQLLQLGKENGFYPYRVDIDSMASITEENNNFWKTVTQIKKAIDPKGIIAPGRYCPLPKDDC